MAEFPKAGKRNDIAKTFTKWFSSMKSRSTTELLKDYIVDQIFDNYNSLIEIGLCERCDYRVSYINKEDTGNNGKKSIDVIVPLMLEDLEKIKDHITADIEEDFVDKKALAAKWANHDFSGFRDLFVMSRMTGKKKVLYDLHSKYPNNLFTLDREFIPDAVREKNYVLVNEYVENLARYLEDMINSEQKKTITRSIMCLSWENVSWEIYDAVNKRLTEMYSMEFNIERENFRMLAESHCEAMLLASILLSTPHIHSSYFLELFKKKKEDDKRHPVIECSQLSASRVVTSVVEAGFGSVMNPDNFKVNLIKIKKGRGIVARDAYAAYICRNEKWWKAMNNIGCFYANFSNSLLFAAMVDQQCFDICVNIFKHEEDSQINMVKENVDVYHDDIKISRETKFPPGGGVSADSHKFLRQMRANSICGYRRSEFPEVSTAIDVKLNKYALFSVYRLWSSLKVFLGGSEVYLTVNYSESVLKVSVDVDDATKINPTNTHIMELGMGILLEIFDTDTKTFIPHSWVSFEKIDDGTYVFFIMVEKYMMRAKEKILKQISPDDINDAVISAREFIYTAKPLPEVESIDKVEIDTELKRGVGSSYHLFFKIYQNPYVESQMSPYVMSIAKLLTYADIDDDFVVDDSDERDVLITYVMSIIQPIYRLTCSNEDLFHDILQLVWPSLDITALLKNRSSYIDRQITTIERIMEIEDEMVNFWESDTYTAEKNSQMLEEKAKVFEGFDMNLETILRTKYLEDDDFTHLPASKKRREVEKLIWNEYYSIDGATKYVLNDYLSYYLEMDPKTQTRFIRNTTSRYIKDRNDIPILAPFRKVVSWRDIYSTPMAADMVITPNFKPRGYIIAKGSSTKTISAHTGRYIYFYSEVSGRLLSFTITLDKIVRKKKDVTDDDDDDDDNQINVTHSIPSSPSPSITVPVVSEADTVVERLFIPIITEKSGEEEVKIDITVRVEDEYKILYTTPIVIKYVEDPPLVVACYRMFSKLPKLIRTVGGTEVEVQGIPTTSRGITLT